MDAQIGRLLTALDDFGLRKNTVVVAVADHGESLGEHGYYYDHGRYVYEQSMHVPLIVAGPPGFGGFTGTGRETDADIITLPSICDFLLARLGADAGETKPGPRKAALSTSNVVFGEALEGDSNYRMVVACAGDEAPIYKLILDARTGAVKLYDLSSDAGETKNLAPARAGITRALLGALEEHFAAQPALPSGGPSDAETMKKLRSLGYM
jgi:arylsulfatase